MNHGKNVVFNFTMCGAHINRVMSSKIAILATWHNFVGLCLCNEGTYRQSKKHVKQQYVLHMLPQYGELQPTSGWVRSSSLGYPYKFQRVSRLGSVTARHSTIGHQLNFAALTEGATYIRQGGHHVGHWALALLSSPNLNRRRLDVYHTCTHGVALVPGSLQIQDTTNSSKIAIWAPWHNFVGLCLCNEGTYRQSKKTC